MLSSESAGLIEPGSWSSSVSRNLAAVLYSGLTRACRFATSREKAADVDFEHNAPRFKGFNFGKRVVSEPF